MTICEMNGKPIIEVRRIGPASIATQAELYTPDGSFLRSHDTTIEELGVPIELRDRSGNSLRVGGFVATGCTFVGCRIGVHLKADGSVTVAIPKIR
jgi:hypothetical protein